MMCTFLVLPPEFAFWLHHIPFSTDLHRDIQQIKINLNQSYLFNFYEGLGIGECF